MKKLLCTILLMGSFVLPYAQSLQIRFDCDNPKKILEQNLQEGKNVEVIFFGKKENVEKYFNYSKLKNTDNEDSLIVVLREIDTKLTTKEKFITDSLKTIKKDSTELVVVITQSGYGTDSTFFLLFSKDGTTFEETPIKVATINPVATDVKDSKGTSFPVIDRGMTAAINGSVSCQLCDLYSNRVEIKSRKDRLYSTDYIITYDPLLKKDAYTICKHIFERKKGKLYERYIKIGAMWFAPHVGSQIRFEVINQSLTKSLKLTVDEQDVFNSGSGQFASLITGLINSNIITPVSGSGATAGGDSAKQQKADEKPKIPEQLNEIASQVLQYVVQFKISSCAIQQHYNNLSVIITRINSIFNIAATNADEIAIQLAKKIEAEVTDETEKSKAIKEAEAITAALKALENVQPIAYTTLRAKNRDYIEVKYTDANNVLSKPENIRMSGGMKIDFSAGFVLTGLRDYTYALKDVAVQYTPIGSTEVRDTTGNVIIKEDDGNNQVGVGILTHFYPRISSHYNFGGTVGLMTSTSLNLRLMLGGSFMVSSLFGSNNRISFSGGIVWGKVKRLSVQNEDFFNHPRIVNTQPQFYSQAAAPLPIDRNEHSWFFALTMNFGGN